LRRGPWIRAGGPGQESPGKLAIDLFGEFELALAALAQKPGYQQSMARRVAQARACLTVPDAASWPDRYAPETLRLAARAKKLNRRFAEAVSLAGDAIRLSEKLVRRFPELVSYALVDQSRYLLLAHPDEPERAVEACRQAIARWPASGDRKRGAAIQRSLALYLLAAGDEPGARKCLASLEPRRPGWDLDRLIGYGLGELCQKIGAAFGPTRRPKWFNDRLQRYLELLPDWPDGRFFAAYVALEAGATETAIAHLEAMTPLVDEPSAMARVVISLLQRFPGNSALQAFARTRFGIVLSTTQPVATAPTATEPMAMPPAATQPLATPPAQLEDHGNS
jgi:tetratricopeptide (TPR) repeat protein